MDDMITLGMHAEADRTTAALADIARVLGGYRTALIESGFSDGDAMELVIQYQLWFFATAQRKKDGG